MRFVTWIEAILVVTLLAIAVAATVVARTVTQDAREDAKPDEAAFSRRAQVGEYEQALAQKRDELSRVHAKLVDARAEIVRRDAELAARVGNAEQARAAADAARRQLRGLQAYLAQEQKSVRTLEGALAARRKSASRAFGDAKRAFDRTTRMISLATASGAVLLLFAIAFAIVSTPKVRNTLHIHRGIVFVTTALLLPFVALYELLREPGIVLAAAIAVLVLVILIARATPPQESRG